MKFLMIFLSLISLYAVGILLFTKGFLLKRIVVGKNSTCSPADREDISLNDGHGASTSQAGNCWLQPSFKKAVIIVIDALRFDFVAHEDDKWTDDVPHYLNKLTILAKTANKRPSNARLYRFTADPPTTTLQRLKGLTTGSLPTFVDAGANFASTEITEDNIIDQFFALRRNITFLGDDTWQVNCYLTYITH
jgi:GPI ethanolamine phosphate transferase 3 subunit O